MSVRFATNIGTRHAQQLGLNPAECKEGDVVPDGKADEIRAVCGPASIVGIEKKAKAKPEPSDAELEKLTAPEPAKDPAKK